jgi:hypothetical protein
MTTPDNSLKFTIPSELEPLLVGEKSLVEVMESQLVSKGVENESRGKGEEQNLESPDTVRGQFLAWLFSEIKNKQWHLPCKVEVFSTRIDGDLGLENLEIDFPISFIDCVFSRPIYLNGAKILSLDFVNCSLGIVQASFIECQRSLRLLSCTVHGNEISLRSGKIDGDLVLQGTKLVPQGRFNLLADGLTVKLDALFIDDFRLKGRIDLRAASIGGDLVFENAQLESPKWEIEDDFVLVADSIHVGGGVRLSEGFHSVGSISFTEAKIEGRFQCDKGFFENPGKTTFFGGGIKIKGPALFRDFTSSGAVDIFEAELGSILDCSGGKFEGSEPFVLRVKSSSIDSNVFMGKNFHAQGNVNIIATKIGGYLYCAEGQFDNPNGTALDASGIVVEGSAFFGESVVSGILNLYGSHIKGEFDCDHANFKGGLIEGEESRKCLFAQQMIIAGKWKLRHFPEKPNGEIWLSNAKVGMISDDSNSWPAQGMLITDGFEYDGFLYNEEANIKSRIKWINLQKSEYKGVQPYEQLASVYRKMGLRSEARQVLIEKEKFIFSRTENRFLKAWKWFLGQTIDFGYSPQKILIPILICIVAGVFAFQYANTVNVMTPTTSPVAKASGGYEPYPQFNSILYSLDVFLPIVDLHQESYWLPNISRPYGIWFVVYMSLHILAGWFLTTLGVASVTGLIKTD